MDKTEFEKDCHIDPEALDVECLRQPEVFYKWAERAVEARGRVDREKLRLEVLEARLELECRQDPAGFGIEGERVTEAGIKAAVKTHPKLLKAHEEYFQCRADSGMMDRAVEAMEMKKRQLENLVTLHGQSYFAGPSTPRNLGAVYLAQQKRGEDRLTARQVKVTRKRAK